MRKISDRFVLGAVAGTAGSVAAYLMEVVAKKMGFEQRTWAERGKTLVVSQAFDSDKAAGLSGLFVSQAIGMVAAIPLVYIQSLSGRDRPLVKGAIYGSLTWLGFYGLGQRAAGTFLSTPGAALSNLASNLVYGTVTSSVIARLGDDKLFASRGAEVDMYDADEAGESLAGWAKDNQVFRETPIH